MRTKKLMPGSHRQARFSVQSAFLYGYHELGQWLYVFGACCELYSKRTMRSLCRILLTGLRAVWRAIVLALSFIWRGVCSIGRDLVAPFRKALTSTQSLFEVIRLSGSRGSRYTKERLWAFFRYGWMWNKHLLFRMLNYVLPAVAFVLCVMVIRTVVGLNFALAVNLNGQTVGYVENENVYNSARKIVTSRMITGGDLNWAAGAELHLMVVDEREIMNQHTMAETLLSVSGEQIVEATGLYVGGEFYGATAAGDLLQEAIDETIQPFEEQAVELGDDVVVKFKRDIELVSGIFPAESVLSLTTMRALVQDDTPVDIYYEAQAGEMLADIAMKNGISVDTLAELNPGVERTLSGNVRLLVAQDEPLLSVKTVRQIVETETIPYETTITRDDRFESTFIFPVIDGQEGERTTTIEVEYQDGEVVSERIISQEITVPAIDRQIIMGAKPTSGGHGVGDGILCWPTIPLGYGCGISRGWTGSHFGVDIWSAHGTPIYAADDGVVIVSTSIPWDYGTYIIVDHQNGMLTVYGHNSVNLVQVGDVVSQGEPIALMGSTGNSTGNHIHFEVRLTSQSGNQGRVDPNLYLHYW